MENKKLQMAVATTDKNQSRKNHFNSETTTLILQSSTRPQQEKHPETGVLFVLLSFVAMNIGCFSLLSKMPEPSNALLQLFGQAPPIFYINIACGLFISTEVILTLCRDSKIMSRRTACKQLFFLTIFYTFYWFSGDLELNIIPLFFSGIILMTSEYIRLLHLSKKTTRQNVSLG